MWHASSVLLDSSPVFEAWETQSGVFFLQQVVLVRLNGLVVDSTVDIFVLFTRHKRIVGIILYVRLMAALSVAFRWLSGVIDLRSAGAGVYFLPWHGWHWLRLRVCDVFNVFEVGKCVQVFV